ASELVKLFSGIRIMDSTEFKLPANLAAEFPGYSESCTAACAAIQFEYDVISRQIKYMTLENARISDKTYADQRMNDIKPGELIIRDLGYYSVDSYEQIEKQEAFYISRLKSQVTIYEKTKEGYQPLSWPKIIKLIKNCKEKCFDKTVYIGCQQKKKVRLMAWLLDEEAQKQRLKKKQKKKRSLNEQDKVWSQLNVFITNIAFEIITPQQAYDLYKIRWQIELIFKIWKSILKINQVRKMKANRFKCYLYSKLLWVLLCWDITSGFAPIIWKGNNKLISFFKCYALLKSKVIRLKEILFDNAEQLRLWLNAMFKKFIDFGLKENKNNRKKAEEILQFKKQ
ncbi:MAG TPA: IS4 family transposase, partial [Chitinophagaceae bacterium]|nr:IS4 family transposase [Chitinophagaceae bacterium]